MSKGIFETWAPIYRECGLEPRPVKPGTKACRLKGWTKPDSEFSPEVLESWIHDFGHYGIGLRMGTELPGGGRLGAVDIDRDEYVGLAKVLLGNPPCGRFGSKGAVYFVRVVGDLGNPKFKVAGEVGKVWGQVVECLFNKTFCVVPPTIHPDTNSAYVWIGSPVHELNFSNIPIIGE